MSQNLWFKETSLLNRKTIKNEDGLDPSAELVAQQLILHVDLQTDRRYLQQTTRDHDPAVIDVPSISARCS